MRHNGMCTNNQIWIKMKTPIRFNNKGNEINAWCLFNVWSCFFMNSHHHYMCCCRRCSLHRICANRINNDDVHHNPKVVLGDKDVHLTLGVMREKVGDLPLNMCFTFQGNSYNSILKCIVGWCMITPTRTPKQMGT